MLKNQVRFLKITPTSGGLSRVFLVISIAPRTVRSCTTSIQRVQRTMWPVNMAPPPNSTSNRKPDTSPPHPGPCLSRLINQTLGNGPIHKRTRSDYQTPGTPIPYYWYPRRVDSGPTWGVAIRPRTVRRASTVGSKWKRSTYTTIWVRHTRSSIPPGQWGVYNPIVPWHSIQIVPVVSDPYYCGGGGVVVRCRCGESVVVIVWISTEHRTRQTVSRCDVATNTGASRIDRLISSQFAIPVRSRYVQQLFAIHIVGAQPQPTPEWRHEHVTIVITTSHHGQYTTNTQERMLACIVIFCCHSIMNTRAYDTAIMYRLSCPRSILI